MPTERLRDAWARDEPVLNAWLLLERSASAAVVASAGFDAVTLDLQHGAASPEDAPDVVAAVERAGAVPLVRPRRNDPAEIMRLLDVGARGIVCPMVGSREESEALVAASRYPPAGLRSYGPVRGALGSGPEHVRRSNDATVVLAMIETAEGFSNLDAIASTPGLDGIHVGPADLSLGLGLATFADLTDPGMLEALDAVVAAARRYRIVAGVHAPSPAASVAMVERGFRFVTPAIDADLLGAAAAAAVGDVRSGLGGSSG
ncbi:MAG: HpcH/HpaI aldolase family protein [Actinomycetota bacterium]